MPGDPQALARAPARRGGSALPARVVAGAHAGPLLRRIDASVPGAGGGCAPHLLGLTPGAEAVQVGVLDCLLLGLCVEGIAVAVLPRAVALVAHRSPRLVGRCEAVQQHLVAGDR